MKLVQFVPSSALQCSRLWHIAVQCTLAGAVFSIGWDWGLGTSEVGGANYQTLSHSQQDWSGCPAASSHPSCSAGRRREGKKGGWIDEWAWLHLGCIVPVCQACCGLWMVHIERPVISRGTTQPRGMPICPQCSYGMPWMPTMVPPIITG